jgi:hypothetical protein
MLSFIQIIEAFGGPIPFGNAVKIPSSHARTMKARNSIPPGYWPDVVAEAEKRRLHGVTYEALAKCAGRRVRNRGTSRVAA